MGGFNIGLDSPDAPYGSLATRIKVYPDTAPFKVMRKIQEAPFSHRTIETSRNAELNDAGSHFARCPLWASFPDLDAHEREVRFCPINGHRQRNAACPKSAKRRHPKEIPRTAFNVCGVVDYRTPKISYLMNRFSGSVERCTILPTACRWFSHAYFSELVRRSAQSRCRARRGCR